MRAAGPLPVAVPDDAAAYLRERRALLEDRLCDVDGRTGQHLLADVRVSGVALKITPLRR